MLVRQLLVVPYPLSRKGVHVNIDAGKATSITIEADSLDKSHTIFTAIRTVTPSSAISRILTQLSQCKLPVEATGPIKTLNIHIEPGQPLRKHVPSLDLFPFAFQNFIDGVTDELQFLAEKTYKFMRWRYDISGKHSPFSRRLADFSLDDGITWHPLPCRINGELRIAPHIDLDLYDHKTIEDFVNSDSEEPLPYEIILEAKQLYEEGNYRSALMMGVTGLELAVKRHIRLAVPNAEWLITETPAPPTLRLLTEYLPKLSLPKDFKQFPRLKKDLVQRIRGIIKERNTLVHSPSRVIIRSSYVDDALLLIQGIDWTLTYCQGYSWALEYIDSSIKSELRWVDQK